MFLIVKENGEETLRTTTLLIFFFVAFSATTDAQNFSNKGKEFWVGYGHNQLFNNPAVNNGPKNSQTMVLYLSAEAAARVTVSVNGTTWIRNYTVPANTVIVTEEMPKTGAGLDARITKEGLNTRGIHIESDVPIVAYAHTYGATSSGATMLIPVESYGYRYISMNAEQVYSDSYSFFYVVAKDNNTRVRITPSFLTLNGRVRNVPFEVDLQKGEMYSVMGAPIGTDKSYDMSGSKVQSIAGADGTCHPVAVFSGSSRTAICPAALGYGGDFMMQQCFPVSAWGNQYLTNVTSSSTRPSHLNFNRFRVYVSDPSASVYRNGVALTGLYNQSVYEFLSNTSDNITCSKPIMVAQFILTQGECNSIGLGDPEMIYLSPIEQAIKKVVFYNTDKEDIKANYLTLTIPQVGLSSLRIDGVNSFDTSYVHPNMPGYQVVIKQLPVAPGQHTLESDTTFTAITYGVGANESYGYNAGTYLNNLSVIPEIANNGVGSTAPNTCPNTPFRLAIKTIYQATSITWHFSQVPGISPAADVVQNNPTPSGTVVVNNRTYNIYTLTGNYSFAAQGEYNLPVSIVDPINIDNCSSTEKALVKIPVIAGPEVQLAASVTCNGESTTFTGIIPQGDIVAWNWDMGDGNKYTTASPVHTYATFGDYTVKLHIERLADACTTDSSKKVTVHPLPTASFSMPDIVCVPDGKGIFTNTTTWTGGNTSNLQYMWTVNGGTPITGVNLQYTFASATNTSIQLLATSPMGCKGKADSLFNKFGALPVADFTMSETEICPDAEVRFVDQSTASGAVITGRQWALGEGNPVSTTQPVKTYTKGGNYNILLTVTTDQGCKSTSPPQMLKVYNRPVADAGPDKMVTLGKSVILQGQVSDPLATVTWSPVIALTGEHSLNPTVSPETNQLYYLEVIGEHQCTAKDSVLVKVYKELLVPNAFSPNNDGVNDKWEIPGLQDYQNATVDVFNRWGQRVFHSTGYSRAWDGRLNGTDLPAGAYYYVIQPKESGYSVMKGAVLIIR